jgi:hypothetical protein
MKTTRFVGLDQHANSISVAVAEEGRDGEVRSLGNIPHDREAISKLIKQLGPAGMVSRHLPVVWAIAVQVEREQAAAAEQPQRRAA